MMIHNPKPRIGIFTRPIDKGTSGSGHHLHEMVRTMLQINREKELFEFFFVHYVKTDRDIYHLAKEVFIPRNPSAAAVLRKYNFDLLHHSRSPYSLRSQVYSKTGRDHTRRAQYHSTILHND